MRIAVEIFETTEYIIITLSLSFARKVFAAETGAGARIGDIFRPGKRKIKAARNDDQDSFYQTIDTCDFTRIKRVVNIVARPGGKFADRPRRADPSPELCDGHRRLTSYVQQCKSYANHRRSAWASWTEQCTIASTTVQRVILPLLLSCSTARSVNITHVNAAQNERVLNAFTLQVSGDNDTRGEQPRCRGHARIVLHICSSGGVQWRDNMNVLII